MTTPRKVMLVVASLLLAAVAFLGGMRWGGRDVSTAAVGDGAVASEAATRTADAGLAASTESLAPSQQPSSSPPSATQWPPLPPNDQPIAEIYETLADRARRGDTSAACRLGSELQRCAGALARKELSENLQDQAARADRVPNGMIESIANLERQHEVFAGKCDGLQPEQLASAFDWQRQAALARPELRVWFALNPALDRRDFVTDLERWADYRRVALPWLQQAAHNGDPEALIALTRIYGDHRRNSPPYPPFRIRDDVQAVVYADLAGRYGIEFRGIQIGESQARARMTEEQIARAREVADGLYRTDLPAADEKVLAGAMSKTFDPVPAAEECGE